jgi:HlyD family secretion protein
MHHVIYPFIVLLLFSCNDERESFTVENQDLTVSVYASTNVQSKNQYRVFASVTGIVKQVLVNEGDTVLTNQPLILVENSNPALNSENALLQLNLAKENLSGSSSRLSNIQLQMDVAQQRMVEDSVNFARQQNLWNQKIGSKLELENRALALKSSRSNYEQLKKQYQLTKKELAVMLQQAENNYQISLKTKTDFEIKSLMNGMVYAVYKEVGELVSLQEPVALVGHASEYVLQMEIDEQDIISVALGQRVALRMDAFKDQIFEATVSKIYPLMNARSQTFLVEAEFDKNITGIFPGMSGEANIVIEQKKDVISIPLNYLIEGKFVSTEENEQHPVETGLRTLDRIEILSGLKEGDIILKPAS